VVQEAQDDSGSAGGSRAASPTSESDLGGSETASGSPRRDTTARIQPALKPKPEEKSAKLERRKSMLNMLTSFLPTLTSSADPTAVAHPQQLQLQHQQQPPHRKPIPNPQQAPGGYWQPVTPVYVVNGPIPVAHGWPSTAAFPPAPLQPPPPPPKEPHSHNRNASLPTMLRKEPKVVAASPPHMPVVTAPQPSPPLKHSQQRGRSASPSPRAVSSKLQSNRLQPRLPSGSLAPRGRSTSAQPPIDRSLAAEPPRTASNPANPVPRSSASSDGSDSPSTKTKRKNWLHGGGSRSGSNDMDAQGGVGAWIMTPSGRVDYNPSILANGEKVYAAQFIRHSLCPVLTVR